MRPDLDELQPEIWPWKCKDAIFQYNEAFDTCQNQDGQAWDADYGDGTVYQYNYSHNNGGGSVMFCGGEAINNIFRYNISQTIIVIRTAPCKYRSRILCSHQFKFRTYLFI